METKLQINLLPANLDIKFITYSESARLQTDRSPVLRPCGYTKGSSRHHRRQRPLRLNFKNVVLNPLSIEMFHFRNEQFK